MVSKPLGQRCKFLLLNSRLSLGGLPPPTSTLCLFCSLGMLDCVLRLPDSGSSCRPFPVTSPPAVQVCLGLPPSVSMLGRYCVITCHRALSSADCNDSRVVLCLLTVSPTISCLRMGFICLLIITSQHLAHCPHIVDIQ